MKRHLRPCRSLAPEIFIVILLAPQMAAASVKGGRDVPTSPSCRQSLAAGSPAHVDLLLAAATECGAASGPNDIGIPATTDADSDNAAEPSMQCVLMRAAVAAFSPLGPEADEPAPGDAEGGFDAQAAGNAKSQTPSTQNPQPPSVQDLGFPPELTRANPQEQARLDRRSHMLKIHQRLGLITAIPMIATVFSGAFAGGRATSSTNRDLHAALGSATAGLYFTTAYFAIFAPKIAGTPTRGPIRLHKALAWIHGPGMVLTPILGVMAFDQKSRGERVHGIASAHGAVGVVTAAAFGLAILSVSVKF